jgi:taurine dioxygenase
MALVVKPLQADLPFGARIAGVTRELLQDQATRRELKRLFEDRGLLVFEGVEPSGEMQVAISAVFGPLKDHPVPSVARVKQDTMPGVIDMSNNADNATIVELDGRQLSSWLPWHFDHCYNNELNRAGVLRAIEIPPEGGLTGFADGIQLYRAFSPELRQRIDGCKIIYTLNLVYTEMRFGRPENFKVIRTGPTTYKVVEHAKRLPRAIHPAVWTRPSGEKVLHVSPWMSVGIEGHEDADGDALLGAVCKEIEQRVQPYFHRWQRTDMLVWDNWRMLHSVSGCDPKYFRRMHRTTIKGDYGLGYFEKNGVGNELLEMTV